jgi:hypothetical protein
VRCSVTSRRGCGRSNTWRRSSFVTIAAFRQA